jgi:hypothetical protein
VQRIQPLLLCSLLLATLACGDGEKGDGKKKDHDGGKRSEREEGRKKGSEDAPLEEVPPQTCRVEARGVELASQVRESSGLAASQRHPGIFWTHGDSGGEPEIYAVRADGSLAGTVRVTGATNTDWEDIARGPCPGGGDCLYVADTGDNRRKRKVVTIWRVPEPGPSAAATAPATRLDATYPEGPRDTEALFVLPDGAAYVISKGDKVPIDLFRWPAASSSGVSGVMERIREVAPRPEQSGDRVTGASASPDGKWVAVRSLGSLMIFRTADLLRPGGGPYTTADLATLGEPQGEGVSLGSHGQVVLSSEGSGKRIPGMLSRLVCDLP